VKKTAFWLILLAVVLAIAILVFRSPRQVDPASAKASPAKTSRPGSTTPRTVGVAAAGNQANVAPAPEATGDSLVDPVHVFDDGGAVDAEFVARYGVKAPDVARLSQARDAAIAAIAALDVSHVQLDPGNDDNVFRGTVAPYPKEGAAVHDQFYGLLREILGNDGYGDYMAREYVVPSEAVAYEILNAGLFQKEFAFDRTVDANGQPVIKVALQRVLHFPAGTGGLAHTPTDVKSSIEGNIRTRSELQAYDSFLVTIAPSWVP